MNKFRAIAYIIIGMMLVYLILIVIIPFLADTTVSVNTTLAASHNMSDYPGTSEFLLSIPWILYVVPGAIGIIAIVIILRRGARA